MLVSSVFVCTAFLCLFVWGTCSAVLCRWILAHIFLISCLLVWRLDVEEVIGYIYGCVFYRRGGVAVSLVDRVHEREACMLDGKKSGKPNLER